MAGGRSAVADQRHRSRVVTTDLRPVAPATARGFRDPRRPSVAVGAEADPMVFIRARLREGEAGALRPGYVGLPPKPRRSASCAPLVAMLTPRRSGPAGLGRSACGFPATADDQEAGRPATRAYRAGVDAVCGCRARRGCRCGSTVRRIFGSQARSGARAEVLPSAGGRPALGPSRWLSRAIRVRAQ